MKRRKIEAKRHLKTFLSVLFIFALGFFLGNILTGIIVEDFTQEQQDISNYILSLDLQMRLSEENICDIDIFEITSEKVRLGNRLTMLENEMDEDNPELIGLKTQYTLLSIRQWLLVEKVKEQCGNGLTVILFFYSNEDNKSINQHQGYVLDYIYEKYSDLVVTYAFDYDLDTPALTTLKELYEIDGTPTLIVDGEKFEGFQSTYIIEKMIFTS
jgi:hypothetical protein